MEESLPERPATKALERTELLAFFRKVVAENEADRVFLLGLERDLKRFMANAMASSKYVNETVHVTAQTSYHRMLIHKLADLLGLDHSSEAAEDALLSSKRSVSVRVPIKGLATWPAEPPKDGDDGADDIQGMVARLEGDGHLVKSSELESARLGQQMSILKRETRTSSGSSLLTDAGSAQGGLSLEEKQSRYKEARRRIFGDEAPAATLPDEPPEVESVAVPASGETAPTSAPATRKTAPYTTWQVDHHESLPPPPPAPPPQIQPPLLPLLPRAEHFEWYHAGLPPAPQPHPWPVHHFPQYAHAGPTPELAGPGFRNGYAWYDEAGPYAQYGGDPHHHHYDYTTSGAHGGLPPTSRYNGYVAAPHGEGGLTNTSYDPDFYKVPRGQPRSTKLFDPNASQAQARKPRSR